jgi:hypothetical protein
MELDDAGIPIATSRPRHNLGNSDVQGVQIKDASVQPSDPYPWVGFGGVGRRDHSAMLR